jgi:NAD(P)-dependent dehydrogenase (short-subunit alcohol dehydrogenase family)
MRDLSKKSDLISKAKEKRLTSFLRLIQLDVNDENSVKTAIETIVIESERIDILVNNAGYVLSGALEDLSIEELKNQFETNVFGLIRVTQSVIPIMRKQHSGIIININSGLGQFGTRISSAYSSSKFAVEGLSESMSFELEPFGIRTVIIEPGIIKTNLGSSLAVAKKAQAPNTPYIDQMKSVGKLMFKLVEKANDPQIVANVVLNAITDINPKIRYMAGKDIEQIMQLKNELSDEEFHAYINKIHQSN